MPCERLEELTHAWRLQVEELAREVAELHNRVRTLSRADYQTLQSNVEAARISVESARLSLEAHRYEHGCPMVPSRLVEEFQRAILAGGLLAAMRWLNDKVTYRFTAVFAFHGDTLRNLCLVDKENPDITGSADQPITESYCIYIHRTGDRFSVEQSLDDPRVNGHPKQTNFQCYYGVPLVDAQRKLRGTVCHFDVGPTVVREDMVAALDELAPYISEAAFGTRNNLNHPAPTPLR